MSVLSHHKLRETALLTLFFCFLTLLFTYPIWTAPDTYLNELGDVRLVAWILAWDAHALIADPLGIFNANIFFPHTGALAFSENFLGQAALVAPVNWAGHPVLAYNLLLLLSFILSGVGTTLWVRHITGSLAAGLLAGVIWAFAPAKFDHLPQLHMLAGQWVPFALLFCGKYVETAKARYLWATAALAGLQFSFSMHYGLFLFPVLVAYGGLLLMLLPAAAARRRPARTLRDVAGAAVIGALFVLPIAIPYFEASAAYGFERGIREVVTYSAQPKSFVSASVVNKAAHVRRLYERYRSVEANFFPGVAVLLLASWAFLVLLPRAARGFHSRLHSGAAPARRWLARIAAAATIFMLVFHIVSLVVAQWWTRPAALEPVLAWSQAVGPALWLAVAATLWVAVLPSARTSSAADRRNVYLLVVAYLALLTYLLAYGPIVHGWNFEMGRGPYWILYRWVRPYQGVRAVGRIGLLWVLFVAALAAFAFRALVERDGRAGSGISGAMRSSRGFAILRRGPGRGRGAAGEPAKVPGELAKVPGESAKVPGDFAKVPGDLAKVPGDLAKVPGDLASVPRGHGGVSSERGEARVGRRVTFAGVALAAVIAIVVWEFRVWPLPHEIAAPDADPGDRWLAAQQGEFGVVQVPLQPGRQPWRDTAYMLGSTLHWKRLVNGYSGFVPPDYARLAEAPPLGAEFFRLLRSDFPVRYMIVHDDWLANEAQHARLRSVLASSGDAELVYREGYTYVFTVPRDRESGTLVRRRYTAGQLEGKRGVRFQMRVPAREEYEGVLVQGGWGDRVEGIAASDSWSGGSLPLPDGFVEALDGGPGAFEISSHALVPVGETGALIASGVILDVQDDGSGVGIDERWLYQSSAPGFFAHTIERYGTVAPQTAAFPPDAAGAAALRDHVAGLAEGTTVAVVVTLPEPRRLDAAALEALRAIGADPPAAEVLPKLIALGRRGAAPGQALQIIHHKRAVLEIDAPAPVIELLGITLFE